MGRHGQTPAATEGKTTTNGSEAGQRLNSQIAN
jgi:hypothetical protein